MFNLKGAQFSNERIQNDFSYFVMELAQNNNRVEQLKSVKCFVLVIYDEGDEYFRKMFNDRVFWEALDKKTGKLLAVIAYGEKIPEAKPMMGLMLANSKGQFPSFGERNSEILENVFGIKLSPEQMPALLVFSLSGRNACVEIASLDPDSKDDAYKMFRDLMTKLAKALEKADRELLESPSEVLEIARHSLESRVRFLEIKRGIRQLREWSWVTSLAKLLWGH